MKKFLATLLAGTTLLLSACSTQTAYVKSPAGKLTYEDSQTFFLFGIGQEKTVNAVEVCGGEAKIAKVESERFIRTRDIRYLYTSYCSRLLPII